MLLISFQVWDANPVANSTAQPLPYPMYLLKNLMKITKNPSPAYNFKIFLGSLIKYAKLHYSLFGRIKGELMQKPTKAVFERTSGTFKAFLEQEKLTALIPLFLISNAAQGYGYIDEIGALYGLMWNTPNFIVSLALRSLGIKQDPFRVYVLKDGFENVWNTVVKEEKFDIRFLTSIQNIDRDEHGVKIHYRDSMSKEHTEDCGFLIWTPPMPDLLQSLSRPTKEETSLFTSLTPHIFVSTLMKGQGKITNPPIVYYRETLEDKIEGAVTAEMGMEGTLNYCEKDCSSIENMSSNMNGFADIKTVLQLRKTAINEMESNEIVRSHYEKGFNATDIEFLDTITWQYFYKWAPRELAQGNHWKVFDIQGTNRTWYAGSSVCFESVKSVMEYNKLLLRQLGKSIRLLSINISRLNMMKPSIDD